MTSEMFEDSALKLELRDDDLAVSVLWSGRSTAREPAKLILRVLTKAVELSSQEGKPLILDFQNIGYMSSSTITPIIRVLDRAKRSVSSVRVLYNRAVKWQELSFTALEVFETGDQRLEIRGV